MSEEGSPTFKPFSRPSTGWIYEADGIEVRVWPPKRSAWDLQVALWEGEEDGIDYVRDDDPPLRFDSLDDLLASLMGEVPNGYEIAKALAGVATPTEPQEWRKGDRFPFDEDTYCKTHGACVCTRNKGAIWDREAGCGLHRRDTNHGQDCHDQQRASVRSAGKA